MKKIFTRLFQSHLKQQSCIVLFGDDIQSLSQICIEQHKHKAIHVYQVLHDANQKSVKIESQNSEWTFVSLNLINQAALKDLMQHIRLQAHQIELCIFQPSFLPYPQKEADLTQQIEQQWQNTGLSAVSVSQIMIKQMLRQQGGTLIFLGGQPTMAAHVDLLSQSIFAGIRALSQSLAREFHPKGIHIAYCMLPDWDSQNRSLMTSVQNVCWHIHQQPESTWSQELSMNI
ncbi:SDR family NAD(P)-dependent oxidoreductase [Acinetobacter modestus]|uniref:SDR family NAD(P)-dependent oxidoreductase n=1 Tax=Acinetobacter modestus TaxID=1776740 RepID=UPI003209377B